jgi:CMP-N,N'-diacetyllegionaminic acid synthase
MLSNKKILAVTLARGGSKGIPRKNITPILGIPLIAYTILEAKKSKYIDDYVVSTDDAEIKSVSLEYGAQVPFFRPAQLSSDTATSADALIHAVEEMEKIKNTKYDIVIELMCTNPLKDHTDIDLVLEKLVNKDADSVISVVKLEDHHPIRIKKIEDDFLLDFCLYEKPENRRQDLKPDAYIRNGAIYAVKRSVLMDTRWRYGTQNSRPHIIESRRSINIDEPLDLVVAEILLKEQSKKREYLLDS